MAVMTYREALNQAMREEMDRDENVFLIGEDIGIYQGTYRVTAGLYEKYGPSRVWDSPISEPGVVGLATGSAMVGLRPVIEMMTFSFAILALDQTMNHAAKMLSMSGGQFNVPMVIRGPAGAGRQLSAQHTHSLESWFAHCPGLKVVMPFTPADAKGMLKTAIRDDNPVIFMEHGWLYGVRGEVPEDPEFLVPFGVASIQKEGSDVTIIAYSRMVIEAMKAAERLENQGIHAEVIDLRSILPLDDEAIYSSIKKTHRAVVVQEEWRNVGFAAEISARIQENCFDELDAPVERVCGLNVPTPYARNLDKLVFPVEQDIFNAAMKVLA